MFFYNGSYLSTVGADILCELDDIIKEIKQNIYKYKRASAITDEQNFSKFRAIIVRFENLCVILTSVILTSSIRDKSKSSDFYKCFIENITTMSHEFRNEYNAIVARFDFKPPIEPVPSSAVAVRPPAAEARVEQPSRSLNFVGIFTRKNTSAVVPEQQPQPVSDPAVSDLIKKINTSIAETRISLSILKGNAQNEQLSKQIHDTINDGIIKDIEELVNRTSSSSDRLTLQKTIDYLAGDCAALNKEYQKIITPSQVWQEARARAQLMASEAVSPAVSPHKPLPPVLQTSISQAGIRASAEGMKGSMASDALSATDQAAAATRGTAALTSSFALPSSRASAQD